MIHSGGRVLKNVTGLDLCKLLSGSHGTLAVLTEITLKVLPAPDRRGTLVLNGLSIPSAGWRRWRRRSGRRTPCPPPPICRQRGAVRPARLARRRR